MTSSVSFRITRTAEDLAQTITALSQRLVKLEQRQEALELQLRQQQQDLNAVPDEEISTLEGVEALLRETRELLDSTAPVAEDSMLEESSQNDSWGHEDGQDMNRDVA
ncbi:chemotaxis protein [Synechococcus sp. HB1133]|uniref:chemotaxis protein n=1 Tax=unclassified Synechococcus TaxID=2626047 RepID=UPI00140BA52A|nr:MULTISPECIES: chemotaxis protein [unclassified Synechococcus]MCB4421523.1 chemotaxis protein [Synechococcus sp. HB1133]MCB4431125.1 chemotaxis protein [Synechococcus sp. HBA1120]NHI80465.1 chemotaxis protein [Synechococcus sp. HB1133]